MLKTAWPLLREILIISATASLTYAVLRWCFP